jgi:hypothetical protein
VLANEFGETLLLLIPKLRLGTAASGQGGNRMMVAPPLSQLVDPGDADLKHRRNLFDCFAAFVTGSHDPFAEIFGIGIHAGTPFWQRA